MRYPVPILSLIVLAALTESWRDDLEAYASTESVAVTRQTLADQIGVELPPMPVLGRRFYDGAVQIPLTIKGEPGAAKKITASLHHNAGNHPNEADKNPTRTTVFAPPADRRFTVMFDRVPYGAYTLRILADEAILAEELLAVCHRAPEPVPSDQWVWGMDTHADRNDRRWDIDLPSLREQGANWARIEFLWHDITDDKGNPNFAHHDLVVNEAAGRGIRLYGCLTTTARHAEIIPGGDWGSPPKLDAYETWCRQVMTHFKGRITHWEILNEPDGYAFWWFTRGRGRPEHHAEMIKIAARVAREISPNIHVMAPSLTVIGTPYFRRLIESGAFADIADISAHFYPTRHPRSFHKQLQRLLAERYPGRTFTFWATEGGAWDGVYLANFAEANPVRIFKYVDRDKGADRSNFEHNNGLIKQCGTPKENYVKYQNLARCFGNARYVGRALAGRTLEAYLFERGGRFSLAVWSDILPAKPLPRPANPLLCVLDSLGNPVLVDPIPLAGVEDPIIIQNLSADSDWVLDAAVNSSLDYCLAGPDKPVDATFTFQNPTDRPLKFDLELIPPAGWSVRDTRLACDLAPGKSATQSTRLDLPADTASGDFRLDAVLRVAGRTIAKRFGPVGVVNPLRIKHRIVDDFEGPGKWVFPEQTDVHTAGDDWGRKRKARDLKTLITDNRFTPVKSPVFAGQQAGRFEFGWTRPKDGWGWMACAFQLQKPLVLPGRPLELRMKIHMDDIKTDYPITLLALFVDATGQTFRIEGGGEIYWTGWKDFRMVVPSPLGDGYIHSRWGGADDGRIHYPLKFAGLIFNLPARSHITFMPEDTPRVRGRLTLDDLEIVYDE